MVSPDDTIVPVEDFILVRRVQITRETASGIALPDRMETKYEGEVAAVGPGRNGAPMIVSVGQRVLFLPHAGIPIQHGDARKLLVRQDAVFAVVQGATANGSARRNRRR